MKRIIITSCLSMMAEAFALTVNPQTLPPSPWADTEISTNVPFASRPANELLKDFRVALSLHATSSNNVQIAFGRDCDANGELALEETDLTLAWDCGQWKLNDKYTWLPATANEEKDFECILRFRRGMPATISLSENNISIPSPASDLSEFYNSTWTLMRITVRGVDNAEERLKISASQYGFVFKIL